eukprot:scaffold11310_cov107-Isochrysis_galbana.AAC.7
MQRDARISGSKSARFRADLPMTVAPWTLRPPAAPRDTGARTRRSSCLLPSCAMWPRSQS